jgi:hypothetical protein
MELYGEMFEDGDGDWIDWSRLIIDFDKISVAVVDGPAGHKILHKIIHSE